MLENPEPFKEKSERYFGRVDWLRERGWSLDDAAEYAKLHEIWLQDELAPGEQQRAEALEKKYQVAGKFGVMNAFTAPETGQDS